MSRRLRAFRLRLAALLHPRRQQREYAEELAFHQHLLRQRLEREGIPPVDLDPATRRTFGNPSRLREQLSELRQFSRFENIFRDLNYATRVLRKSPGFTLTAILTIALGIGASTAIFSLVNGLLLRPLPVHDAHQLAVIGYAERIADHTFAVPLFRAVERNPGAFANVFAYGSIELQIGNRGGNTLIPAVGVSGQYFSALGVSPLLGRYLTPADDVSGTSPSGLAVVLTERYWRMAFHRDPHVIGKSLLVSKVPFTIVGVMPERFIGANPTARPQIFIPLSAEPLVDAPINMTAAGYHAWWLTVMGRMKPGVSVAQAQASLASATGDALSGPDSDAEWAADARRSNFRFTVEPAPGGYSYIRQFFRQPLQVVLGLCCAMLLLACLNLASLLFARAAAREHELATRVAVGASRRRLIQQLLTESLFLASAGACLGLIAAPFVARALAILLLERFTGSYLDTSIDWRVLAAAAVSTILSTLLVGLLPALHATGTNLRTRLKGNQITTASFARRSLPQILLSAQVALALMLVVGAGLLSTSLVRLYRTGFGFDARNLCSVRLSMLKQPLDGDPLIRWYQTLQEQVTALPDVKSAAEMEIVPFEGSSANDLFNRPGRQPQPVDENIISPGYFQTMRIPLLNGRDFAWSDTAHDVGKIVLSRSAAALLFPHEDPLGQQIDGVRKQHYQVIGVVGDAKYYDVRAAAPPMAYLAITQSTAHKPSYTLLARSDGPLSPFAAAIRNLLARTAPHIPAPVFNTMSATLDQSLSAERMMALLSVFFAVCALLVTAIGLYGTLAYRTACHTSEIGIRMALGAQRTQVVSLVFRQNVAVTLIGALAGLGAAMLAARALASFLYGTSTHDPLVLALSTLLLALVASVASLLPAIRAARINPLTAIRTE
jgi:putative ABC transport system permease protein